MWLVWLVLIISTLLVGATARSIWRRTHGNVVVDFFGMPVPWKSDAMALGLGFIGVASTVLGLVFGQPNWAIDCVYRIISGVMGNAV